MVSELLQMPPELLTHIFLCMDSCLETLLRWISFFIACLQEPTDHCSCKQTCQYTHLRDRPCAFPTGIWPSCWWMWRACQGKKKSWSHKRLTVLNLQVLHKQFLCYPQFPYMHARTHTQSTMLSLSPRVTKMIQDAGHVTTLLKVRLLKKAWAVSIVSRFPVLEC